MKNKNRLMGPEAIKARKKNARVESHMIGFLRKLRKNNPTDNVRIERSNHVSPPVSPDKTPFSAATQRFEEARHDNGIDQASMSPDQNLDNSDAVQSIGNRALAAQGLKPEQ